MLVSEGNGQRIDLIVHVCYGRSPAVDCHQSVSVLLSSHVHSLSYYDSTCANVTSVDLGTCVGACRCDHVARDSGNELFLLC